MQATLEKYSADGWEFWRPLVPTLRVSLSSEGAESLIFVTGSLVLLCHRSGCGPGRAGQFLAEPDFRNACSHALTSATCSGMLLWPVSSARSNFFGPGITL